MVRVTEYKDRIQTVERTVTVEKPVIQYRDRVTTRTVYRDGPVRETIVTDDKSSKATGGKETTTDARKTEDVASKTSVAPAPEGRWSVRVAAGLDSAGSVLAGAGADYRLLGPVTVGAWATAPVAGAAGRFSGGVSVGLRLP